MVDGNGRPAASNSVIVTWEVAAAFPSARALLIPAWRGSAGRTCVKNGSALSMSLRPRLPGASKSSRCMRRMLALCSAGPTAGKLARSASWRLTIAVIERSGLYSLSGCERQCF